MEDKGIKIDNSHHHHTVYYWRGFIVENHYDFINIHTRKSNKVLETVFKELGKDDRFFVERNGVTIYLPSLNLNALFLLRHAIAHFTSTSISLRQVLDWAFFVEKHTKEIDWDWLISILKEYNYYVFFNCLNAICVENLNFDVRLFPQLQFESSLKDKVFSDILKPEFEVVEPDRLLSRLLYKFQRWRSNAWKNRFCFNESLWSIFWSGIRSHLINLTKF